MKYRKFFILVLIIIIAVGAVGCEKNGQTVDNKENEAIEDNIDFTPVEGGSVILPLTKFDTLNPLLTENSNYYYFSKLVFEGLFEFNDELNIQEQLAESYQIKEDGRVIEIKLKDNIYWHDGQKFSADDIAFTINTIKYANTDSTYNTMFSNAMGSFRPTDLRRIMDVSILDERNLVISFDRAFSNNLEVLTFPIIPKHNFITETGKNTGFINALKLEDYVPIGTGPYKFQTYEKMKQIKLVANDNYRNGRPYIDEIVGRVLDSEEDILTAFETGQINVATTIGVDWEKYSQNNRIRTIEYVSSNYEFLGFNFENEIFAGENGKELRKIINYAIDRQSIISNLYLGHGTQIDVPIHPDSWLLGDSGHVYGYNLEMAKKDFEKLNINNSEDDKEEVLTFNLLTNTYNPIRLRTAEMIKEDLEKIGINVNIFPERKKQDNITKEDIQEQWNEVNEILESGEFDMVLLGWQLSVIPDLSFIFHSSQIPYSTNIIRYNNETMDALLEKAFLNGNRADKLNNYKELQNFIVEDLPYISLFFKNKALLIDNKIKGELEPNFYNPYRGIERSYIPKDLQ